MVKNSNSALPDAEVEAFSLPPQLISQLESRPTRARAKNFFQWRIKDMVIMSGLHKPQLASVMICDFTALFADLCKAGGRIGGCCVPFWFWRRFWDAIAYIHFA